MVTSRIQKSSIFGNWVDQYGYPISMRVLPFVSRFSFITPNVVTLFGFFLYIFACISLFLPYSNHLLVSALLLPIAYLCDQLDGQLARYKKMGSDTGDYLDKILDVIKIFAITTALSYAVYLQTQNILFIYMGFATCFLFNLRYYIKLETVLKQAEKDVNYLTKCRNESDMLEKRYVTEAEHEKKKGITGWFRAFWIYNKTFLFVDEGEFALFVAIFALSNQLVLGLIILCISQLCIVIFRSIQRPYQAIHKPEELIEFVRK